MAKDKILFDTRKEKITPEKFEELWAMCKKEDEKRNEEWDKLSKEERKELESELESNSLYQRFRWEMFDDD